uniref:Ribonuclease H protein At1g65750 family n=1 Tax=Cajanus cajan TaxID=3821 RepID=A0A151QPJ6_CAJCA|nr:Putative ribonuclease H protein At1g65750 family [Cajanus cajan]
MKVGTFNCRGLGGKVKSHRISELIRSEELDFIAIQETKLEMCDTARCAQLWGSTKFEWFASPSHGRSGGLLSIWNSDRGKLLFSFSGSGFHGVCLQWGVDAYRCVVVNVYSSCHLVDKRRLWGDIIMSKRGFGSCLWCIVGDFNTVRRLEERKGGFGDHGARDMEEFNSFITEMELIDVPLVGKRFTWFRSDGSIMSRLDRVLVSESWSAHWGAGFVKVIPRDVSDHCPLILNHKVLNWGPKPFRFNNCWLSHCGIEGVVRSAWEKQVQGPWAAQRLRSKLLNVKNALKKWNIEVFERNRQKELVAGIWSARRNKLTLLAQKARIRWGKYGDQNSKYFHACIRGRQRRNQIVALKMGERMVEEVHEIKQVVWSYFDEHFKARSWLRPRLSLAGFPVVSNEQNARLVGDFTEEEVNFRPISLLGCLYKIISKVLVNRLRGILPSIISENQSAFIPGRHLLDSFLVASEAIDYAQKYKKQIFVMKIDYEKAYDSVEWDYLLFMIQGCGFHERWVRWMEACVCGGSLSTLVNGSPTAEVSLGRGLKQGDPLAPSLFLIAAEGLRLLMSRASEMNLFKGLHIGDEGPPVSLLQFADDTLIIGEATMQNLWCLKAILRGFELISGMKINFHKSCVVGIHSGADFTNLAAAFLHCKVGQLPFKHLGLPLGANPRKLYTWKPMLDSFRKRLSSWKYKHLSIGGRVTLINSVLNAIPIHFLSFFKAPNLVIKEIVAIQRDFLWRGVKDDSKIPWVKWETVCKSKVEGGLGIKDVRLFNWALLGKWVWRCMQSPGMLWAKVLHHRYGRIESFSNCSNVDRKASWWWKDIVWVLHQGNYWLDEKIERCIGDGTMTRFWEDKWIGGLRLLEVFPRSVNILLDMLQGLQVISSRQDYWRWIYDKDGVFSVKSAYLWLQRSVSGELRNSSDFQLVIKSLWKCKAPIKCLVFCWQVLLNAFPYKSLLQVRGVELENNLCSFCSLFVENPLHLFLMCPMAFNTWLAVAKWLEVTVVFPNSIFSHYLYWTNLGIYEKHSQLLQVVWVSIIWSLWLHRNVIIFQQGTIDAKEVLDNIKLRSWKWINCSISVCSFSY